MRLDCLLVVILSRPTLLNPTLNVRCVRIKKIMIEFICFRRATTARRSQHPHPALPHGVRLAHNPLRSFEASTDRSQILFQSRTPFTLQDRIDLASILVDIPRERREGPATHKLVSQKVFYLSSCAREYYLFIDSISFRAILGRLGTTTIGRQEDWK